MGKHAPNFLLPWAQLVVASTITRANSEVIFTDAFML
jgi:hypothetical protein